MAWTVDMYPQLDLLNQYSPVSRECSSIAGKDASSPVSLGVRVARAQIYAGVGPTRPEGGFGTMCTAQY